MLPRDLIVGYSVSRGRQFDFFPAGPTHLVPQVTSLGSAARLTVQEATRGGGAT
jgi:hypothetical protein